MKIRIFPSICLLLMPLVLMNVSCSTALGAPTSDLAADVTLDVSHRKKPQATILITLVNTSDHDITVITEGLEYSHNDRDKNPWACEIGYTVTISDEKDHLIVPSLADLAPVTLHPNEGAIASFEFDEGEKEAVAAFKRGIPIIVTYTISEKWGKRLGIWSGSVAAKPAKEMKGK